MIVKSELELVEKVKHEMMKVFPSCGAKRNIFATEKILAQILKTLMSSSRQK